MIKKMDEIELMRHAGRINYLTHKEIEKNLKVGISTLKLNDIAHKFILKNNCEPSFLNYNGYPKSICISLNDEVVHGIPSMRKIKNGDVVSIDIGVCYQGYHSDSAYTYIVGEVNEDIKNLVDNTKKALYKGLSVIKDGIKVSDIGLVVARIAHENHLSVIEELVGHGVGIKLHEAPDIPNYKTNMKQTLKAGMTIAVEPMLNLGRRHIYMDEDDWTIKTEDGLPSAHFEHTVLVTKNGYQILTGE